MLRFVFGASGAGKSTYIYKEIIGRAEKNPDRNFLILVPDQFTMQVQSDVVKMSSSKGIMNIDVLSFSRLVHRIFSETGKPKEKILDDLGKSLLLRRVSQFIKKELPSIGSGMTRAGFVDEVKSVISEFMQYDLSYEQIDEMIKASKDKRALCAKLKDLNTLYKAFNDYISEKYMSAENSLSLCAQKIYKSEFIKDSVIAFDGFTGFTPIQYRVLKSLYNKSSELIFSVIIGDEVNPYEQNSNVKGLFSLSQKTVADLSRNMWETEAKDTMSFAAWEEQRKKSGVDVFLGTKNAPVHRLKNSPSISHLEKNLFRYPLKEYEGEDCAISISVASTPYEEVRQSFILIHKKLAEDRSLQYKDFAIVSAVPKDYTDAIDRLSVDFDIPVFMDKTENIRNNPIFEYLRSIIEIVKTSYSKDAVLQYLKSGLAPYERRDVELLEVYINSLNIQGRKKWESLFIRPFKDNIKRSEEDTFTILEKINKLREQIVNRFRNIFEVKEKKGGAGELTIAIYKILMEDKVPEKLRSYEEKFASASEEAFASEYRQILSKINTLFEETVNLLSDEKISVKEYGDILEAGFSELSIGTIPVNVDRVQIGDIERTRLKDIRYLIFLGAHDMAVPSRNSGAGLISEVDREFLRANCAGTELAPSPIELMYRQRLYLYMSMTKPSQGLSIFYPRLDTSRKSLQPSYIIGRLKKMFPKLDIKEPEKDDIVSQAVSLKDMQKKSAVLVRDYAGGYLESSLTGDFMTLTAALNSYKDTENDILGKEIRAAFTSYSESSLSADIAKRLYSRIKLNSISRLELFAGCAYAQFLKYGLGLKENRTADFSFADLGTIYHSVIELFSAQLREKNKTWLTFTYSEAEEYIETALGRFTAENSAVLYDSKKGRYEISSMKRILLRTVETLKYQLGKGDFMPAYAEEYFRSANSLHGRIDRIDLAEDADNVYVKIIDFKSGSKDFDYAFLFNGLQMQLITYMDAALERIKNEYKKKNKSVVASALLYYRIIDPVINADDEGIGMESSAEEIEGSIRKSLHTTGIVNADDKIIKKLDRDIESSSDVIPVGYKRDGSFTAASRVFDNEEYKLISEHVSDIENKFGELILEGKKSIHPYNYEGKIKACTYCRYKSICRFDEAVSGYEYRNISRMSMEDMLCAIKEKHA